MASMSPINTAGIMSGPSSNGGSVSPRQAPTPKNVAFELLFLDSPQYRARLPMRVQIYPHDTTDSIVTTVKNFYGLYSGPTGSKGVSFEDEHGNTLIARYENFRNNMVVYVRVIEEPPVPTAAIESHHYRGAPMGSDAYYGGDGYSMQQRIGQDLGRPASRSSRRRSQSPGASRGRRSDSASTNGKKGRSRSTKNRGSMMQSHDAYTDSMNGYSSGDNAPSTTSGKAKEQLGTTDISVENIVEGGRRKRAKFESSELPLFAPPQMPAATSNPSVSPARRIEHHHRPSLSYVQPSQNPFTNPRPLQSPQSYSSGHTQSGMYTTPAPDRRGRGSISYGSNGIPNGMGILPTPDPTVGSCMSEEDKDVAIQLMRLGEMSNISHGRTSASTLDDTFSGRADAASSTGATSDGESESDGELPPSRRQKLDIMSVSRQIYQTTESHFMPPLESTEVSGDDADYEDGIDMQPKPIPNKPKHKSSASLSKSASIKTVKAPRPSNGSKSKKAPTVANGPMSPASISHSRKQSVASNANVPQSGEDDQPDLSTKPRCQRCRKSKKGCDRQRPCGRCRDAGLSADQCISEDEGNGRKGRYGRHMGVPLKKDEMPAPLSPLSCPPPPSPLPQ
ncbi:putative transcriptional regulatory protein C56F2.05c [Cladobotryum mycophilum]|uniref:Transcriptional regulatory protein C56F2.05c n=1 Tax=Cladobotryum mycophilum TaxID=491253 RepID=A0ABR0SM54_9HYPO